LEEISKATKISVRLLNAIEMDRYDVLPEGIFRKSFIKNYAGYLGMNEDKVLQEYLVATQTTLPPPEEKVGGSRILFNPQRHYLRWAIQGLIALLLAGVIYWYFFRSREKNKQEFVSGVGRSSVPGLSVQHRPSPDASDASSPSKSSPKTGPPLGSQSPSTSSGSTGPELRVLGELARKPEPPAVVPQPSNSVPRENPAPSTSQPGELILGISATEECWLSVSAGSAPLYAGVLEPEQNKRFPIQKPLRLTFGNAGGVKLSVNGKPLAAIGKLGEVRVLEIAPENYQQYLAVTQ
jgi:cytoskeletal protein RodZ